MMRSWVLWRLGVLGLLCNLSIIVSALPHEQGSPHSTRSHASNGDDRANTKVLKKSWLKAGAAGLILGTTGLGFLHVTAGDRCLRRSLKILEDEIVRDAAYRNQLVRHEKLGDPIRWPDSSKSLEEIIQGCEEQTGRKIDPDRPANAQRIAAGYKGCRDRCGLIPADPANREEHHECLVGCDRKWSLPQSMYISQHQQGHPSGQEHDERRLPNDGDEPTGNVNPLMVKKVQKTGHAWQNRVGNVVQGMPGTAEGMRNAMAAGGKEAGKNLRAQAPHFLPALARVGSGMIAGSAAGAGTPHPVLIGI